MRGMYNAGFVAMVVALTVTLSGCSPTEEFEQDPSRLPSPQPSESSSASPSSEPSATASATPSPTDPSSATRLYVYNPDDWNDAYTPEFAALETANADGSVGSGCAPPSPDTLSDGIWKGLVRDSGSDWIDFDLVCSYNVNSERVRDWVDEHEDAGPPPPEVLTRNNNPATRRVYFSADAVASDALFSFETAPPDWSWDDIVAAAGESDYVWLWVNGGRITEIQLAYES